MIDRMHYYEYHFFFQGAKCSLFQFVRISGNDFEVLVERVRSIGIDKSYAILQLKTGLRQIASFKSAYNGTAAKCIGELLIEGREQFLISRFGQIREIGFNPCLFG